MSINVTTIAGNLGRDPEIKYLESGKIVASFSLAVPTFGQGEKGTLWMPCKAWAKVAELIGEHAKKGQMLTVTGRLDQETWEKDDAKHSKVVLVVQDVQLPPKATQTQDVQEDDIPF